MLAERLKLHSQRDEGSGNAYQEALGNIHMFLLGAAGALAQRSVRRYSITARSSVRRFGRKGIIGRLGNFKSN